MTELLLSYGFAYIGTCNCSGTRNEKYFNGRYYVYLQPKRRLFKIKEGNQTIEELRPYSEIETYLPLYAKIPAKSVPV